MSEETQQEEQKPKRVTKKPKKPLSDLTVWDVGKRVERELKRLPLDEQISLVGTLYVKYTRVPTP